MIDKAALGLSNRGTVWLAAFLHDLLVSLLSSLEMVLFLLFLNFAVLLVIPGYGF